MDVSHGGTENTEFISEKNTFFFADYFGAIFSRYSPMQAYTTLGSHTAISGERFPPVANVVEICMNMMYVKLSVMPSPS